MAVRSKSPRRARKGGRPEMSSGGFGANAGLIAEGSYCRMDMQLASAFQQNDFVWPTNMDQEALPSHPRPRPRPETNGISEAMLNKLTPKQEAFVREYLVDLNGAAAARRAGYSKNSAKQIASENLTKPDVLMA